MDRKLRFTPTAEQYVAVMLQSWGPITVADLTTRFKGDLTESEVRGALSRLRRKKIARRVLRQDHGLTPRGRKLAMRIGADIAMLLAGRGDRRLRTVPHGDER